MNNKYFSLKHLFLTLLVFFGVFITAQEVVQTNFEKRTDSSLVNSVFYIPGENLFTPKFYAINGGATQFSVDPLLMDYGWYSKLFTLNYDHISYERDSIPRLEVRYDYGMDLTHWFGVDFHRPVGESDIFLKFNRNFSDPLYINTEVESSNLVFGSKIQLSNNYSISVGYFRNRTIISETGGLESFEDYQSAAELEEGSVNLKLSSANNNIFNNGLILNHKLQMLSFKDSIGIERSSIGLNFGSKMEEDRYTFSMDKSDLDSGYFANIFLDSTGTFDSIGMRKIVIKPSLYWLSTDTSRGLEIGYEKHIYDYESLSRSSVFLSSNYKVNSTNLRLSASYQLESFWKGNYTAELRVEKEFKGKDLEFVLKSESKTPEFLFLHYSGNHFKWDNSFASVKMQTGKFKFTHDKLNSSLEADVKYLNDHIYFDETNNLLQVSENIIISKLKIHNVIGSKMVRFSTGVVAQFSNSKLIRMPKLYTKNTLSFDFSVRSVPLSLGGVFTYYTSYKGLSYNPALRHYKLGMSTVGGFPVIDLFFVVRLGTADLYLKYDNLFFETEGRDMLLGDDFTLVKPFLHFGLKWELMR